MTYKQLLDENTTPLFYFVTFTLKPTEDIEAQLPTLSDGYAPAYDSRH